MSVIEVKELSTSYGKKNVLNGISFEANAGEILGILGENGSGKSTMIKSICNILPHLGGCYINEELLSTQSLNLPAQLEKMSSKQLANFCSYVPQKSGFEIEMSVLDVVLMGFNPKLKLFTDPDSKMRERAVELLESFGFKENSDFMSLSEGQKQMCILLRSMVADCSLILMDEPENALDVRMRHKMMNLIKQWVKQETRAVIVALHDIDLALNYCDRLMLIKDAKISAILNPRSDSLESMSAELTKVYGDVSLRRIADDTGKEHLVMLKENLI